MENYKQRAKERELAPNQSTKQNRERERERDGKVGEDVKVVTCSGRPGWQWWVRVLVCVCAVYCSYWKLIFVTLLSEESFLCGCFSYKAYTAKPKIKEREGLVRT